LLKSQRYDITITAKYRDDKNFSKKIYQGFFVTKIPPQIIYNFNNAGVSNKTEDITWDIVPKISDGKYIDIDLTHQVMSIFQDGLRKGSYKVSSGKRGMNTPTGTFHILSKRRRPWSAHYGLYMPWYMGFTTKGHGIHELPEWPSGYKEGVNHLGIPVSHGCVRLGVGPAKAVYDFSIKGTPVVIHY
jgi:lipoprotein-anchoring transpeptidase ErfK/SrfK